MDYCLSVSKEAASEIPENNPFKWEQWDTVGGDKIYKFYTRQRNQTDSILHGRIVFLTNKFQGTLYFLEKFKNRAIGDSLQCIFSSFKIGH